MMIADSSSDDSEKDEYYWIHIRNGPSRTRRGGSSLGKTPNIERGRHEAAERLLKDYFGDNPIYTDGSWAFYRLHSPSNY